MPTNDDQTRVGFLPMRKLMEAMAAEDGARKPQPLLAQVSDLEAVFAQFCSVSVFVAGDLARERAGMGMISVDPPPVILILRFLDMTDEFDRASVLAFSSRVMLARPDCLIAFKDDDGDLRICPHESWRLEPYDGERV